MKKNRLFNIAEMQIDQLINNGSIWIYYYIEKNRLQNILYSRLNVKRKDFKQIEQDLDLELFSRFIESPQITDIWFNYLYVIVGSNISKYKSRRLIYEDDIFNYFIEILNKYFNLTDDISIGIIIEYFKLLITIFTEEFEKKEYSEIIEFKNGTATNTYISKDSSWFNELERSINKVKLGIENIFIPKNNYFEKCRQKYTKALRLIYQNGFIYLLGEYNFNSFYIPPILVPYKNSITSNNKLYYAMFEDDSSITRDCWMDIFKDKDIRYIVGGPGYGKSLFLNNIINNYTKLKITNASDHLLIFCDLKTYYSNGNPNKKPLVEFFQESMINITGLGANEITTEFIEYHMNIG